MCDKKTIVKHKYRIVPCKGMMWRIEKWNGVFWDPCSTEVSRSVYEAMRYIDAKLREDEWLTQSPIEYP